MVSVRVLENHVAPSSCVAKSSLGGPPDSAPSTRNRFVSGCGQHQVRRPAQPARTAAEAPTGPNTSVTAVAARGRIAGWSIASAALTPLLMITGWLVAGAQQPATYSPVRQSISTLAGYAGTDRWIMTAALFGVGLCYLITAAGARTAPAPARILLALIGLASIGIAARPEPAHGSLTGHMVCTIIGAALLAVFPALFARCRRPRSFVLSGRGSITTTAIFLALVAWLAAADLTNGMVGAAERVVGSIEPAWPLAVVLALRKQETANQRDKALDPR